tara:strand:+ start:1050 stop:1673 length:624 start_codon:yes stop_codon:yes gene_type:complete
MLKQCLRRSWKDSLTFIGGPQALVALIAIPVVGFALHSQFGAINEVLDQFHIWLIYGLTATGLVFLTVFVWNLTQSPYRVERDKRRELQAQLAKFGTGSVMQSFTGRSEYSLDTVAKLLAGENENYDLIFHDLCEAVISNKLNPNAANTFDKSELSILRSNMVRYQGGLSPERFKNLKFTKAELLRFLPKRGYGIPLWLEATEHSRP